MLVRWKAELVPSFISTFLLLLQLCTEAWAKTVYMDKYGDCFRGDVIKVDDEKYTVLAQGGEAYDTLVCEMTFESVKDDRLCVEFRSFSIRKCDVRLYVYSSESSHGSTIGSYSCHTGDVTPEPVCSKGKYLTVRMRKDELSHDGYDFNIELRQYMQSDAFAEGIDAYILSIGVIIAVIVGVIVVVILTAVVIVYCCCKRKPYGLVSRTSKKSTSGRTGVTEVPVEPSAPPLPAEAPPPYFENPPPYTSATDVPHRTCMTEPYSSTEVPNSMTEPYSSTEVPHSMIESCQITDEEHEKFKC